ncbi:response regulator transcription factor [uncultured Parasutterella sp.]|uniref:response regulator transcription factor n=1 Tax=uncultured Parasutterella sp. TaxID=1263098 RepID=UPI00261216C6|nr:response regulator [uncultured Parasutterella sp.]
MLDPIIRIVDDEKEVRDSRSFLLRLNGWNTVYYEDGLEFLEHDDFERPGCVILDLRMPKLTGLEVMLELKRKGATLPIVFVTGHADVDSAVLAFKEGAFDFLKKPIKPEILLETVKKLSDYCVRDWEEKASKQHCSDLIEGLTAREMSVAHLVISGLSNKEIAAELDLAEQSVKIYRSNLCHKLNVKNALELKALFDAAGVLDNDKYDPNFFTKTLILK